MVVQQILNNCTIWSIVDDIRRCANYSNEQLLYEISDLPSKSRYNKAVIYERMKDHGKNI